MITEGKREERRRAVAAVATKLFGAAVKPENVVDETLQRAIHVSVPEGGPALRAGVEAPVPTDLVSFTRSPLAAWIEHTFRVEHVPAQDHQQPPLSQDHLNKIWAAYQALPKAVLVHCSAGVDRTGRAVDYIQRRLSEKA